MIQNMKIFMNTYTDNPDGSQTRHIIINNNPNESIKMSFTTHQEDSETEILEKATTALSEQFAVTKTWTKTDHNTWSGECVHVRLKRSISAMKVA